MLPNLSTNSWVFVGLKTLLLRLFLAAPGLMGAGAVFVEPSPYLSVTNSPFNGTGFIYFHLETLEDGLLNTPGATVNGAWAVNLPSLLTDSVDADDGSVDGAGTTGYSLVSRLVETNLTVTFHVASLGGHLPTQAGIVCTDLGSMIVGPEGVGDLIFSARDAAGVFLGSVTYTNFGNGSALGNGAGATAEDRFFGVSNPAGISSISLIATNSLDWEVDHLQYGYLAPDLSRPRLRMQALAPDTVVIAWLTNAIGYALHEASDFSTTNWTLVTNLPSVVSNENQVTVTPLSSNRYYRLID